jgi:hypothetical protein
MKELLTVLVFLSASATTLAANLQCRVDEQRLGGEKLNVPVNKVSERGAGKESVQFLGHELKAELLQNGRSFALVMDFDDLSSIMYEVPVLRKGPVNVMTKGDVRFQCW